MTTWGISWYAWRQDGYPEYTGWRNGKQEPHEIQQEQIPPPVLGKESSAMIWTGTWPDRGAQLCRKCLGGAGGCKLATSKQVAVAIRKAGSILSCINRSMAQRSDYSHLVLLLPSPTNPTDLWYIIKYFNIIYLIPLWIRPISTQDTLAYRRIKYDVLKQMPQPEHLCRERLHHVHR